MKNFTKITLILLTLAVLGEGVYIYSLHKPSLFSKKQETTNKEISINTSDLKRKSLEEFYTKISMANDSKDWSTVYDLADRTTKELLLKEDFVKLMQKKWDS